MKSSYSGFPEGLPIMLEPSGPNFAPHPREFNLPQVVFLATSGFRVILFDYSGCGLSTGKTTIDGLLSDAEAVLSWWQTTTAEGRPLVFFGQGIGCDAALQLYAVFVKIPQKNLLGGFLPLDNLSRGFAPTLRYPRIFIKHE